MAKVKLYNAQGKSVGEKDLRDDVFGIAVNPSFIHEVVISLQGNARKPWAHTKTKGEVSGGGKKPWRQKGTGRARHGSTRNPQWAGGGVAFGPRTDRDYSRKINRKAKRRAFCMALSDKAGSEHLVLVEDIQAKDGKTKEIVALMGKLPVKGKITLVGYEKNEDLSRSTRNLKDLNLVSTENAGLLDILDADYVVMTPMAAEKIEAAAPAKASA